MDLDQVLTFFLQKICRIWGWFDGRDPVAVRALPGRSVHRGGRRVLRAGQFLGLRSVSLSDPHVWRCKSRLIDIFLHAIFCRIMDFYALNCVLFLKISTYQHKNSYFCEIRGLFLRLETGWRIVERIKYDRKCKYYSVLQFRYFYHWGR